MAPVPATLPDSAAVKVLPLISLACEAAAVTCPISPHAESSSAYLGPPSATNATALDSAHLDSDPLLAIAMTTASSIQRAPCINYYLAGKRRQNLYPPPSIENHPASPLLKTYAEIGCPASLGPDWPLDTIKSSIATVAHVSTLKPEATAFCQQELLEQAQRGFRMILPVDVGLLVFGDSICISRLTSVDQANINPRLTCNSSAAPDDFTPAVNTSTNKSTAFNAKKFGACLPRFLQNIWEADPSDGPVWISKWDIYDAFHRCLLRPADIGAFTYVVPPPPPTDISTLLCIDLVLPMGWVNYPDMFCAALETVAGIDNGYLLNPTLAFEIYPAIAGTYSLATSLTSSTARIQYVDVYIDNLNYTTEGNVGQHQRTSGITLRDME